MNILGLAQVLGPVTFAELPSGAELLGWVNECLPQWEQCTITMSGNELQDILSSLDSDEYVYAMDDVILDVAEARSFIAEVEAARQRFITNEECFDTIVVAWGVMVAFIAIALFSYYVIISIQQGHGVDSTLMANVAKGLLILLNE